jgi:predicted Zn-dependent protease
MRLPLSPRPLAALALLLGWASAAWGQSGISERQELAEGRNAARQVEARYRVVAGTSEARQVERIGRRIVAVSARPRLPWSFRVLEEKTPNAFALPGRVYIFTGMLKMIEGDTDALAGVIAHEIAHTAARHTRKQMEKGAFVGLVRYLLYGQDEEYEADRLAVRYLRQTGYDPNGMIRLFRKFRRQEGRGRDHAGWFASHPGTLDRIARIRRWMGHPTAGDAPHD